MKQDSTKHDFTRRASAFRSAAARMSRAVLAPLASLLSTSGTSARASQGPVEATARVVEFRSYDETTGALRVHLVADSAAVVGAEAGLEGARLARYDGSGRLVLRARAAKGSYGRGRGVRLSGSEEGGVEVEWWFRGGTARFRTDHISWDEASDAFRTDSAVLGRVLRRGPVLDLQGCGFVFVTPESRGEIVRDAVLHMGFRPSREGRGAGFRATADRGLVFKSGGEGGLVIRMRGPVATVSTDSSARADGLELRFASGEGGELQLVSGTFTGTVRALVSQRDQSDREQEGGGGLLPGSFLPRLVSRAKRQREPGAADQRIELRAEVIRVITAPGGSGKRVVVLYGTPTDPARVIFDGGELRGTRIDLAEDRITTDGGAPSEFVW